MALSERPRRTSRRRRAQQDVTAQGFSLLTAIGTATDREGAMQAVARGLPDVLGARQGAVVLFGSPPTSASVLYLVAEHEPPFRLESKRPLAAWLQRERQTFVRGASYELLEAGLRGGLVPADAPAMIVAPLVQHNRIIGCVGVCCNMPRRWRQVEITLVEAVARQLGHTLDRIEQLNALESRARLLTAVHDAATRSAQEQELPAALQVIAEQARQLADADTAQLTLSDPGSAPTSVEALRPALPQSADKRDLAASNRNSVRSISMPLALGDRVLGVLELSRHQSLPPFTIADETLINLFAPYAAAAINMAEQHARLERLLKELAQLARGTGDPANTGATVAVIAEAGRRLLGAETCVILEHSPAGPLARHTSGCSDAQLATLLAVVAQRAERADGAGQADAEAIRSELVQLEDGAWCVMLPFTATGSEAGLLSFSWQRRPGWEALRPAAEILAHQIAQLLAGSALHQAAQEATRLKYEFMSTVSHELRTPMGAIIGYTELLANNLYGTIPGTMRDPLVRLKANAAQLLQQINQILDLSRIEAGRLELHVAPFQPRDLVRAVADALHDEASAKGLVFRFSVEPEVPAIAMGDVGRLRQVLLNLVGNSVKFTQHGSVELRCTMIDGGAQRELAFEVRDTGPGIAPDEQDSLWQPFRQGRQQAAGRERSGTGLGLAVVYKLTELMRGQVELHSQLGQGSTFTVRLPLDRLA